LILDLPTSAVGKVTLTGEVEPPLGRPVSPIYIQQQISCSRTRTVAETKPSASGRFDVSFAAPAGEQAAIYRLSPKVRENTHSRTLFGTYSLPEPVVIAP